VCIDNGEKISGRLTLHKVSKTLRPEVKRGIKGNPKGKK